MLPNREGRFKAAVIEHGVSRTGPNRLTTFVGRFKLLDELVEDAWQPVTEDFEIIGYFYLEKRDGSLNSVTIDNLRSAFGWDGCDPMWLQDADLSTGKVQLKIGFEVYQEVERVKVQYIDAENAVPSGVPRADEATRRDINARLGPKFRAHAGGSPAPAPKPAIGSGPSTPTKPTAPVEPEPDRSIEAWESFCQLCPDNWTKKQREDLWFNTLDLMYRDRALKSLSPDEWNRLLDAVKAQNLRGTYFDDSLDKQPNESSEKEAVLDRIRKLALDMSDKTYNEALACCGIPQLPATTNEYSAAELQQIELAFAQSLTNARNRIVQNVEAPGPNGLRPSR